MDDITNPHWLGVVEGVITYLRQQPTIWPLAVGCNKLLMCPISVHAGLPTAAPGAHQLLQEHPLLRPRRARRLRPPGSRRSARG